MKTLLIFLLTALVVISAEAQDLFKPTTFILVRHAEKASDGTDDPDLKPEGQQRAKQLAMMLEKTHVAAILSTRFKRTSNTVKPLADAKSLVIKTYESLKKEDFDALIAEHPGKTIVIAGHSNTVPMMANILTGSDELKPFSDDQYSNALIITTPATGKGNLIWLKY